MTEIEYARSRSPISEAHPGSVLEFAEGPGCALRAYPGYKTISGFCLSLRLRGEMPAHLLGVRHE